MPKGNCTLEERSNQTFLGLMDTYSKSTTIPREPRKHCGSPVKVGTYGDQVINGVLAKF